MMFSIDDACPNSTQTLKHRYRFIIVSFDRIIYGYWLWNWATAAPACLVSRKTDSRPTERYIYRQGIVRYPNYISLCYLWKCLPYSWMYSNIQTNNNNLYWYFEIPGFESGKVATFVFKCRCTYIQTNYFSIIWSDTYIVTVSMHRKHFYKLIQHVKNII